MRLGVWIGMVAALASSSCLGTRYVVQAGFGQLDLWSRARPIDEVLRDPDTDDRTRVLLSEVVHIKDYAAQHGLASKGNYTRYADLERRAVVWFVTASQPLAFEPKIWKFPIVGGFPYLGWFDQRAALAFRNSLEADGWEVFMRPVSAYSTGGWFRDPVLSTMLSDDDDAFRSLANVLFHELVHANVLINDQSIFNESVASFVGDGITADYLGERFGAESAELATYREELARERDYGERLSRAYADLDAVYTSDASDADKRADKRRIIDAVDRELRLGTRPNNAYLIQFKTYNAGFDSFENLRTACGGDWPRFLAAVKSLDGSSFSSEQQEDLAPAIQPLVAQKCLAPQE